MEEKKEKLEKKTKDERISFLEKKNETLRENRISKIPAFGKELLFGKSEKGS